jgi:type I restriction enzyme S subunit|tara:strand:- start:199 stop:1461 length:1263 start_codon:yes stop_codon:yes gene_type:complete
VIESGDVLVSLTRPNLNAVALVDHKHHNQIASTGFEVIKPVLVDSRYIFALVRSKAFIDQISGVVQGALYPAAKSSDVQNFEFPLPPLAEQKVIADKLDTLLAQVENTKARLERIPQILKRFRQSVLAAAVSGRLTEECRDKPHSKSNSVESDFDFLKQTVLLPESWRLATLGEISEKIQDGNYGGDYPKEHEWQEKGIPFITGTALGSSGNIIKDKLRHISPDKHSALKKAQIKPGDIIFPNRGARDSQKNGLDPISYLIPDSITDGNINPQITLIRTSREVSNLYLKVFMDSSLFLSQHKVATGGSALAFINLSKTKKIALPVPPLEEQTEIVRRVDQLFAHADRIEQQVNNALARVNNLTQSILAKAFQGELTEQWRKDNPELITGENSAEALLERIKAERAAMKPVKKSRQKRTTA